ncbi:uncharacterized protein LOC105638353 [Jatropha curcas]|uniref:uncharacterized protein LOC105638353 n=1 Tax=Jatropha curcas TaxID=180498 RepID=UPI0018941015|nr:uncharacterized protein LOC105638353 [Jatropha curcas]
MTLPQTMLGTPPLLLINWLWRVSSSTFDCSQRGFRVLMFYTRYYYYYCLMASSSSSSSSTSLVSTEKFKLFHSIDRELYSLLVINLWRDPVESLQILALWLWMERIGYSNVVKKILSLPSILINELADEAIICLTCINQDQFTSQNSDIPLMQSLMEKEVSLKHFHENRFSAIQGVAKIVNEVCIRAVHDIMQQAIERNATQKVMTAHQPTVVVGVPEEERTMFVTFSKGYPVEAWEVREFFTRRFGDCIESLHMQEVESQQQSLFARIVFNSPSIIQVILSGLDKAKFNINGKHVWARKFVPKRP